jgi:hypothetical protein
VLFGLEGYRGPGWTGGWGRGGGEGAASGDLLAGLGWDGYGWSRTRLLPMLAADMLAAVAARDSTEGRCRRRRLLIDAVGVFVGTEL